MADGLSGAKGFAVDQALHGYGEGHRLLASSKTLAGPDARTMLVLSDISGSDEPPKRGYLTGYPLQESGIFVLARTWSASELPRPGCVWTHSLMIAFADLATLRSPDPLTDLFRRPSGSVTSGYTRPLVVRTPATRDWRGVSVGGGAGLVGALYGSPGTKVVGEYSGERDEELLLEIWMQQWPRLRRGLRFCSFTVGDRSTPGKPFDLQLFAAKRSTRRIQPIDAHETSKEDALSDLDPLLDDLEVPNRDGLRSFLHEIGVDVLDGRRAMLPLVRLFSALRSKAKRGIDLRAAMASLDEIGPKQARGARRLVVERALDRVEDLGDDAFAFVLANLPNDDHGLGPDRLDRLGRSLWVRDPDRFLAALEGGRTLSHAATVALQSMDRDLIVEGLAAVPHGAIGVASRRHDLLSSVSFWRLPGLELGKAFELGARTFDDASAVLSSLMRSGRTDAAEAAVSTFGAARLLGALDALPYGADLDPWILPLRGIPEKVSAALAEGAVQRRGVIEALARALSVDALGSHDGTDPWLAALENAPATEEVWSEYLSAYMLARGLGRRSPTPGLLLAKSFGPVHAALAGDNIPGRSWRLIQDRLPWAMSWDEWDRCARLRQGVVDRFVDADLPAEQFAVIATDDRTWQELVRLAARTGRGRRFLARTLASLETLPGQKLDRIRIVSKACR